MVDPNSGGDGLWTFAVALYGREGVAPACLALQDEHGQDVLLLLFAAWAGARLGLAISPERMSEANAGAEGWRNGVVEVLRSLRRRLKPAPEDPIEPDVAALREEIKRIELGAERIGLARLEATAGGWGPGAGSTDRQAAVMQNLERAFEAVSRRPPDAAAATLLKTIGEAATAG